MKNDAEGTMFEAVIVCHWLRRMSLWRVAKNWWNLRWGGLRGTTYMGDKLDVRHIKGKGYFTVPCGTERFQ